MGISEFMLDNRKKEMKYSQEFRIIFGKNLHDFMDYITGFDIIRFDEWLGTPDDVSTSDYLKEKYGERANELIREVI